MPQLQSLEDYWKGWVAPIRPTTVDLAIYRDNITSGEVLYLGQVKEFAELATHVVTRGKDSVNWLSLPFELQSFDTIFGEKLINLTGPYIIDILRAFLKPGGIILSRTHVRVPEHVCEGKSTRLYQEHDKCYIVKNEIQKRTESSWPGLAAQYHHSSETICLMELEQLPRPDRVIEATYQCSECFPFLIYRSKVTEDLPMVSTTVMDELFNFD